MHGTFPPSSPAVSLAPSAARLRLALAITLILIAVVTPPGVLPVMANGPLSWLQVSVLAVVLMALRIDRVPPRDLARRGLSFLPFAALLVLSIPLLRWHDVAAWKLAAELGVKMSLAWLAGQWLVLSTGLPALLLALRSFGVPGLIVASMHAMEQFRHLLAEEAQRMERARAARLPVAHPWQIWTSRGRLLGLVFIRAIERAERVHLAMRARGYVGEPRFYEPPPVDRALDVSPPSPTAHIDHSPSGDSIAVQPSLRPAAEVAGDLQPECAQR